MKVLLAISDKLFGEAIARFTRAHEWPEDTEFKLISVIAPIQQQPGKSIEERKAGFDKENAQIDKLLSQIKTSLLNNLPGANINCEILVGHTAKEILTCAQNWPASMLILGSHGRRGFEKAFLGSVSFYVASHAPCSFSIVRMLDSDVLEFEMNEEDIPEEMRMYAEA